jgi:hypothetical protein
MAGPNLVSESPDSPGNVHRYSWDLQLHVSINRLILWTRNAQPFCHPHQLCQRSLTVETHKNSAVLRIVTGDKESKFGPFCAQSLREAVRAQNQDAKRSEGGEIR